MQETKGNREDAILEAIQKHVPYNKILQRFHSNPSEITEIKGRRLGTKTASKVGSSLAPFLFKEFAAGKDPVHVVIANAIDPAVVRNLFERYRNDTNHSNQFCTAVYDSQIRPSQEAKENSMIESQTFRSPCRRCGRNLVWDLRDPQDKQQIITILQRGGIGNFCHSRCEGAG
jgi:hypothetical protein